MDMRRPVITEPDSAEAVEQMARYGITRVQTDQFHYKDYRYSRLNDALAQAKRDAS